MVAPAALSSPNPLPASAVAGRGGVVRFTVDDVLAMIRQGMVAEDASAELLNGFIVHTDRSGQGGDPNMHSPGHRKAVRKLTALAAVLDAPSHHVQIQSPIICGRTQMPEPDFALVRGSDDDYTNNLPSASDVLCVIEVADSSLERDRNEKGPIYARAGVPLYIILNLRNRTAEVYGQPDLAAGVYGLPRIVSIDGQIEVRLGDGQVQVVNAGDLLL